MKIQQANKYSNNSSERKYKIEGVGIHHFASDMNEQQAYKWFVEGNRNSPNVAIFSDGKIVQYVPDERRAWTSGYSRNGKAWLGAEKDHRSLTIEIQNDKTQPEYTVSDKAIESLIWYITTKFKEYGIDKATFTGNFTHQNLKLKNNADKIDLGTIWTHRQLAPTACPSDYLYKKLPEIAKRVDENLKNNWLPPTDKEGLYRVQIGAFINRENAEKLAEKLKKDKLQTYVFYSGKYWKVQLGAWKDKTLAYATEVKAKKLGYDVWLIEPDLTDEDIAKEIWTNKNHPYGNGAKRKKILGDRYDNVQKIIENKYI